MQNHTPKALLPFLVLLSLLSGCAAVDPETAALELKPAKFSDLPGWEKDDHSAAFAAFARSCARIDKKDPDTAFSKTGLGGSYGDWQTVCGAMRRTPPGEAKTYFETWFTPYLATMEGSQKKGLFTGYYEAALNGARNRTGPYRYPLRARPDDLVMVDLGAFREDLKGRRIAGRVKEGRLYPYENHQEIVKGKLPPDQDKVLAWTDDPIGAFFMQIQGSGRINFNDGESMRIGYAGQNGHPYYAIGRELIKRGHLEKDKVSLQSIRGWLQQNPDEAWEIMFTNPSYVFFKQLDSSGPLGGEGVVLTPRRSIAVDHTRIPYGAPLWVDIEPPAEKEPPLRQIMIAQDTGGAIRGPVRGDVFWGHGPRAEYLAGKMKSKGRYWLLLPKTISIN